MVTNNHSGKAFDSFIAHLLPAKDFFSSLLEQFGTTPAQIINDLAEFSNDARVLSSDRPRLINEYRKQWIGVYRGAVRAQADTLESLVAQLKAKDIPPECTIVRYIDENRRIMIL